MCCKHVLHNKMDCEHFCFLGRTWRVDSRNASEKSAGREQRLHGLVGMCLPIPTIQEFKEFNQLAD